MFRKAAIVLALAASFLGAQAMDLPKARELTYNKHNKTKSAKPNSGVKSKAKTVSLCLVGADADLVPFDSNGGATFVATSYIFSAAMKVYDCADTNADGTPKANTEAIGDAGINCQFPAAAEYALCTTQITLDTEWHKTQKTSSIAGSFWTSKATLIDSTKNLVEFVAPVVTGVTGAWGKVDNIQSAAITPLDTAPYTNYKLTLGYKGRGWNPAAY